MKTHLAALEKRHIFDAWGKLHNYDQEDSELVRPVVNLGYTGHKAEDAMGIIDMGGRQYDPVLARFLQPDLFVQSPHNMQSFNRYTYVMNNPFRYVDPSGYVGMGREGPVPNSPEAKTGVIAARVDNTEFQEAAEATIAFAWENGTPAGTVNEASELWDATGF